eukprot:gb/GECH01003289.1/.p1 GENE.gb/GECH01003289.1/~~gb/GECH01003289.1/.p1  ORF type:complete len:326 (+),score=71.35 gb/GECH01003289.1/:1-978(+)
MTTIKKDIVDLLKQDKLVKIQAPMVRYSKLPFRLTCKKYDCDVMYTHMIMADSFTRSQEARDNEFQTCPQDGPLVVQFAASDGVCLGRASQFVSPYASAIDINCGCPQRWARQEGIGSALMQDPELVADMVKTAWRMSGVPIAVKIRLCSSGDQETVDFVRQMEAAGAAWISVHGRNYKQRSSSPVSTDSISLIKSAAHVPIVHNGDVFTLDDAHRLAQETGVDGVMSARGILQNPAVYSGADRIPISCLMDFIQLSLSLGLPFITFHHHLNFMVNPLLKQRADRIEFSGMTSVAGVLDFLSDRGVPIFDIAQQSNPFSSDQFSF